MRSLFRLVPALALALLTLGACEEDVDPFVDGSVYYSIYGALDTAADTQFVRVIPITSTVGDGETTVTDGIVRSVRLDDGQTVLWRDSTVTFSDGSVGTLFYAPMRVFPGFSYRIEVERSDGAGTTVRTTVPAAQLSVDVGNVSGISRQRVRWPGIREAPFRVEVWYRFLNQNVRNPFNDVVVVYNEANERSVGTPARNNGGWEIEVQLSGDYELVRDQLAFSPDAPPTLLAVGMRVAERDDQWVPPGGRFDPEVLVQPGLFSNVENGFGFVGSVNNASVEWTLPEDVVQALGYAFPR